MAISFCDGRRVLRDFDTGRKEYRSVEFHERRISRMRYFSALHRRVAIQEFARDAPRLRVQVGNERAAIDVPPLASEDR